MRAKSLNNNEQPHSHISSGHSLSTLQPHIRKLPRQQRSRMLVESVKQACRIILEAHGELSLTASQLSQLSGVGVGSIYQYFPNIHAVAATVMYEDARQGVRARMESAAERIGGCSAEQLLRDMVRTTIGFYRRVLEMNEAASRMFCEEFDLDLIFNLEQQDDHGTTHNVMHLLSVAIPDLHIDDLEMRAFLLTRMLRSAVLETVKSHPEYLASATLENVLVDAAMVALGVAGVRTEK